jgi:acetyl-CoA synthetase
MLVLKRRYEYWFAVIALHKLGAVAIPATHQLTRKDYVYRIRAAGIRMIVTVGDEQVRRHVEAAAAETGLAFRAMTGGHPPEGWLDFTAGVASASETLTRPTGDQTARPEDPMLIYFTSGTTGMPKMVLHNFLYPLGHILTARYWQHCRADGLHLTVADTGWAKASWGKLYGQWICGCAVMAFDMERFDAPALLKVLEKYRVTSFCAPPTIYRFLIKESIDAFDLTALEQAVVAGEPLNPEIYQQFLSATGLMLREGYGQTEMTVALATFPWMAPKPGSMGRPSPGYDIDLIDEQGNSCECGAEGQIVIRTGHSKPPGMFDGYYHDAKLTARTWSHGVYRTGDMAWRDEDGYYWFIGRADDVIKSSGYRIGPFEVESTLLEHPAVLECAVTGVPDPDRGAIVKATVVLAKGYTAGDELARELQQHVKQSTAPYKYPRVVEFVKELPKTISGKIRRVQIREQDQSA